jgi:hypothetical protein
MRVLTNLAEIFQHHQYMFGKKYITVCTLDSADLSYAILHTDTRLAHTPRGSHMTPVTFMD